MGCQVLSCPQWHESGATKSHAKGKKHGVCFCITWGIETRKAQSFEAQVGNARAPGVLTHSQDFSCLCSRSVPQDVQVTCLNCCGERAGGSLSHSFPHLRLRAAFKLRLLPLLPELHCCHAHAWPRAPHVVQVSLLYALTCRWPCLRTAGLFLRVATISRPALPPCLCIVGLGPSQ